MWKESLQWIRAFFDTGQEGEDTQPEERDVTDPAELYECPDCGNVYIRNDSQPCSNCDSDVENVPNERELGLKNN